MSEENEPTIDGRSISEMKVVELKEELGKRGLSKIGNKNTLHDRLKEFLLTEISTKDENDREETAAKVTESPQRDLASPPNPLVAEYLAKQQTALREARKDAEAVRRASSGDDSSPVREKATGGTRRSRRGRRGSAVNAESASPTTTAFEEKPAELTTASETEQENVEAESGDFHATTTVTAGKAEDDSVAGAVVEGMETDEAPEEMDRTEAENDDVKGRETRETKDDEAEEGIASPYVAVPEEQGASSEKEQERRDELNDAVCGGGTDEDASSRSRSESKERDDLNDSSELTAAELEDSTNQELVSEENSRFSGTAETEKPDKEEAVDDGAVEKIEIMERTKEIATMKTESQSSLSVEKKRRWKASDATPTDSSVITVSVTEHKQEQHIEIHENDERPERQSSLASDYKEDLSDTKDKMEELDYEEPVQSSVAEVAEEVKANEESGEKKRKMHTFERHARRPEQLRMRKRSLTPEKPRESHTTVDGFVRERSVSPARYPVNQVIMIRQLTRPYTVKQLQQLLSTFGTIVEGGFWIDNIKSTCIAKFSTVEEAVVARGRLHNIVWPPCSPKTLKIDYSDDANLEKHLAADKPKAEETTKKGAETKRSQKSPLESSASEAPPLRVSVSADEKRRHVQQPAGQGESGKSGKDLDKEERTKREHEHRGRKRPASPSTHTDAKRMRERRSSPKRDERRHPASPQPKPQEPEKRVKTADELFLKTKTQPAIYYLPLTDEQILERAKRKAAEAELARKVAQNAQNGGATSKQKEKEEQLKEKSGGAPAKRPSGGKSPSSRRRSRTPPSRHRSRSPVVQRDRRHSRSRSPRRRR